jgi:hypothetical protein
MRILKYRFSSEDEPFETPTNDGIEGVSGLLDQLNEQGFPVDRVDVAQLTERGGADAYLDEVRATVLKNIRFGKYLEAKESVACFWEASARIDSRGSCQWTSRRGISAPRARRSGADRGVSSGIY